MAPPNTGSHRTLETVARACDVIEALETLDGAGVTEVAEQVGISKSSAHSYLGTLQEKQLVVKHGDQYHLSLEFLYLGNSVRHRHVLFRHGRAHIDHLAEESGEYAHLMCEQHGLERNIYKAAGENAVGDDYHTIKEQKADLLHFTSTGKAVLAYLPSARVEEIVDQYGLVEKTANTITNKTALFDELERIRKHGYAVNDEEEVMGIRAIGAPIQTPNGSVLGALSVSGPTSRLNGDFFTETLPTLITERANVIEANINMSTASRSIDSPTE
ncbi:IclR family transcriptional regulator [Natrarchaeobaculum sulfurireducens]|uniref:DNA-binding transcriptional regulator, IclR family n=1 Tax=Natrarchaeobaculum sulfurireducens TaxID=2044521 RepID=A0A346PK94_9EURY|nr:IclR family transcriptional regulator [Natrarchaeobaculum sulfurireducens]AXR79939.1 DNA-binding transcriptional regulator, IclR family [Natrarchaeobaculum sulfurireducens]